MSKKIKTNNRRRICRSTGCKQLLSIYNLEVYCHVHRQLTDSRDRPMELLARR